MHIYRLLFGVCWPPALCSSRPRPLTHRQGRSQATSMPSSSASANTTRTSCQPAVCRARRGRPRPGAPRHGLPPGCPHDPDRGHRTALPLPLAENIRQVTLRGLLEDRTADDSVVVAFAGHGVQFKKKGRAVLLPDGREAHRAQEPHLAHRGLRRAEEMSGRFQAAHGGRLPERPTFDKARGRLEIDLESVTRPQIKEPPRGVAALFSCSDGREGV